MAKKKVVNNGEKVEFSNIVWCIDNLDVKQLADHDKNPYDGIQCFDKINEMIEDSFKISMRYDTYSKSMLVSAVCQDIDAMNSGLAISARGNDITDACSIMLYKYFNVAKRDLRGFADKIPTGVRG